MPLPDPSISVIAPNGGEQWLRGQVQTIQWSSNRVDNVAIELYKGGVKDSDIDTDTPSDGTYAWIIPGGQTTGTDYKVRIIANDIQP